ncbi:MAG: inositol monophosphatase family protein, partial [Thermoanaerobaculia bacterium]
MTESKRVPAAAPAGAWDRHEIVRLLLLAGERALALRRGLTYELKSDRSLVTQADREIEALFAAEFDRPERGVHLIGEETVAGKGEDYISAALSATAYVVDPIDGTSPYAHRLPTWGVSVGRMEGGTLTDGAVFLPELRLMAASDGPAVLLGNREEGSSSWSWGELSTPPVEDGPGGLVAITQD